jgi:signal transduction histidine kinase
MRCWSDTDTAFIEVADDGDGIPESDAAAIFDPFVSAHGTTTVPSIGVGLSVARKLANLMGGDVTYRRDNGQTRFTVTLPANAPIEV